MDALVTAVWAAFPARLLDEALFAEPNPGWRAYLDGAAFEAAVVGRSWPELDRRLLERHHDVLGHAGPALFVAVLPAYLVALIETSEPYQALPLYLLGALTRRDEPRRRREFDQRVAGLADGQRALVARVLEALLTRKSHQFYRGELTGALERHWRVRRTSAA